MKLPISSWNDGSCGSSPLKQLWDWQLDFRMCDWHVVSLFYKLIIDYAECHAILVPKSSNHPINEINSVISHEIAIGGHKLTTTVALCDYLIADVWESLFLHGNRSPKAFNLLWSSLSLKNDCPRDAVSCT